MSIHGVLDRFENNHAVILIASNHDELIINQTELPSGSKEGTWFNLEKTTHTYIITSINHALTKKMQTETEDLMQQLKKTKKTSKFRRQ
ncbi:MAG TPA: DUF3006 domain-containing protein [Pseudogracilibacillus sp.]|nr:DUF3006 domain-containing protein [Pseudogracilibacillus sp.]